MHTLVQENRYILANVEANNNKFWNAQLYSDGTVVTEWGRVGETGRSKEFPTAGIENFKARCRQKESSGYRALCVAQNGASSKPPKFVITQMAQEQIAHTDPEVAQLIARLARANVHNILSSTSMQYDAMSGLFTTPLGVVTQGAVAEARQLLTEIGAFVSREEYDAPDFASIVNDYLMLIPQNLGRTRPDLRRLYPNLDAVQKQNALLDSVAASLQNLPQNPVKQTPSAPEKAFDVKLRLVRDKQVIDRLCSLFDHTRQAQHACSHLRVKSVYEADIASMRQEFERKGRRLGNVRELWHGTGVANLLSILKSGLRASPPASAHITGRAFGPGIYASDQSTKALNYSYGYWNGVRDTNCFLFLVDMAMGRSYTPKSCAEKLPKFGYHSTFAKAEVSGVGNNEMIAPHDWQVNIKYLVEFEATKEA